MTIRSQLNLIWCKVLKFFCKFCNFYKDDNKDKISGVEITLFYLSFISMAIFSWFILWGEGFQWKYLVALIPVLFWMFLRSSRKDMNATGNLIAGIFGALGGAIIVIVSYMLKP